MTDNITGTNKLIKACAIEIKKKEKYQKLEYKYRIKGYLRYKTIFCYKVAVDV